MKKFRCTFPGLYPPGSIGHKDPSARQGHYFEAHSPEHAAEVVAEEMPSADLTRGMFVQCIDDGELEEGGVLVFPIRELHFPNAWKMGDLFLSWGGDVSRPIRSISLRGKGYPPSYLQCYMSHKGVNGYFSTQVEPRPEVIDFVKSDMIMVDYDHMRFEAIHRKGGNALITVSYGSIIGNRWLALVTDLKEAEAEAEVEDDVKEEEREDAEQK
jgi:hypothetical protein